KLLQLLCYQTNFPAWNGQGESQVHYQPVLLDPNTAARSLYLSEDLSRVKHGETEHQQAPDNPERFSFFAEVLGSEGWIIGVAKESVNTKEEIFDPEVGLWCLDLKDGEFKDVVSSVGLMVTNTDHCLTHDNSTQNLNFNGQMSLTDVHSRKRSCD
uniref:SPRY-associated domain-containing protein n=1 Tax=Neogobius melanostomus TaxID=47308 RepID=A0A8C6UBX5_9GOBI